MIKYVSQPQHGVVKHGSLNVPIEHHPTIRYMVYNGYYKVMSNIPKMGQLPTPVKCDKNPNKSPLKIWKKTDHRDATAVRILIAQGHGPATPVRHAGEAGPEVVVDALDLSMESVCQWYLSIHGI